MKGRVYTTDGRLDLQHVNCFKVALQHVWLRGTTTRHLMQLRLRGTMRTHTLDAASNCVHLNDVTSDNRLSKVSMDMVDIMSHSQAPITHIASKPPSPTLLANCRASFW